MPLFYYDDFESFKGAIADCLAQTDLTNKEELDSLLTRDYSGSV